MTTTLLEPLAVSETSGVMPIEAAMTGTGLT